MKDINVGASEKGGGGRGRAALAQALWFLSTTRNILVVLVCAGLAYYFDTKNQTPFVLTGIVSAIVAHDRHFDKCLHDNIAFLYFLFVIRSVCTT